MRKWFKVYPDCTLYRFTAGKALVVHLDNDLFFYRKQNHIDSRADWRKIFSKVYIKHRPDYWVNNLQKRLAKQIPSGLITLYKKLDIHADAVIFFIADRYLTDSSNTDVRLHQKQNTGYAVRHKRPPDETWTN